jgi:hypothetical protein
MAVCLLGSLEDYGILYKRGDKEKNEITTLGFSLLEID